MHRTSSSAPSTLFETLLFSSSLTLSATTLPICHEVHVMHIYVRWRQFWGEINIYRLFCLPELKYTAFMWIIVHCASTAASMYSSPYMMRCARVKSDLKRWLICLMLPCIVKKESQVIQLSKIMKYEIALKQWLTCLTLPCLSGSIWSSAPSSNRSWGKSMSSDLFSCQFCPIWKVLLNYLQRVK